MQIQPNFSSSKQIITARCKSKTYVIPLSSIRCIVFDEHSKSVTINYMNDVKTILYDDNIKRIYYDTLKDMRSCDNKITEYDVSDIIEL